MIRNTLFSFLLMVGFSVMAARPAGFLWYNLKDEAHKKTKITPPGVAFNRLSFTAKDAILRFYTMEALHKARYTKSVDDMKVFLKLQDYWLKESSRFSATFQKTMLSFPEYDYTVTHPTSNLGTKMMDEARDASRKKVIERLRDSHGLLFFYRGNNPYDQKQVPIIRDFCARFHFSLIPVSVDGTSSKELLESRMDKGQANALGVRFFPALLLVQPQTKKTLPVAFGFTTQDALERRLYQVATQFKGESL